MREPGSARDQVRKRRARIALGVAAVGAATVWPLLPAGAANPPEPTYSGATVDGSAGEWGGGDVFGTLYSNDPPYAPLATASLRYDCEAGVLYAYVAANPGVILQTSDPAEDYVRVGSGKLVSGLSGNDGTAPDFAYVGETADGASGWEASAPLAEGSYPAALRIHAKVPDQSSDGYQVIDLQPRYSNLTVACPVVEATTTIQSSSTELTTTTEDTSTTAPEEPTDTVVEAAVEEAPAAEAVVHDATAFTG